MAEQKQTVCKNPATGETIGFSPLNAVQEVGRAIERSRQAQRAWAATSIQDRTRAILRIRDYVAANADDVAQVISRDNGKTRTDALGTEVLPAIMAADYYAKNARSFLAERMIKPGNPLLANKISKIVRVPFGVIGIISPWNYPFAIPFSEVVMGLLAGNGVILKVASETQLAGRALERAIRAAGLPSDLFAYLNVPGRIAGDAFLEGHIDKLFFTGSVPIGKKLMAKAAQTLTPVSLELGGNDAMLVCPDADLDRAAAGAVWGAFQNAGQSCGGVERVYVHRDVYDDFLKRVGQRVRSLRVGPDIDFNVDVGTMTTANQLRTVRKHVDDALERGATVFAESKCPATEHGLFHPAMVLTDVDHSMLVMREETFGPVMGVMKVDSMDEAIELANDSDLGLTGSVWSRNREQAGQLARRIQAGAIPINDHLMSHGLAETPWGGFKQSGIGRTHGEIGFAEMTEPQCIVQDYLPAVRKNMWWHPHSKAVYQGLRGIIDLLYSDEAGSRVQGAGKLLRLFPRTFRNRG